MTFPAHIPLHYGQLMGALPDDDDGDDDGLSGQASIFTVHSPQLVFLKM
jgi:hypothetical protein